jgi:hypothetical protein
MVALRSLGQSVVDAVKRLRSNAATPARPSPLFELEDGKMEFRFDFEKSLQAAAYLLHLEEGRMPYLPRLARHLS